MSERIKVASKLVVLHGDEMAQVAFEAILDRFVKQKLDIELLEKDLSARNRVKTNGRIVQEAIDDLNNYGIGVKNAGVTVNREQLDELLEEFSELSEDELHPLATKSPNGAIRKGINGNIAREDIPFENLKPVHPDWLDVDIEVVTMNSGGQKDSFNEISDKTGYLQVMFTSEKSRESQILHERIVHKGDPWLLASHDIQKVIDWSHALFKRAINEKKDVYVGLKDTVIPGYDGVMRHAVDEVYNENYKAEFESLSLKYIYGLIDAQAAQIIASPPKNALWGIPDNTSGRKLYKLVESLKKHGLPYRMHQKSISRMSSGGGDQYGSFNMALPEDGIIKICLDGEERHSRVLKKGDPIILQSNEYEAIKNWMKQIFREAIDKGQEVYIGLKAQYMDYDRIFRDLIQEEYLRLLNNGEKRLPPYMVMLPSAQLRKMIVDPPMNACYPALNLDGDIFSDITAALGGSLATASSIIASPKEGGTMLFEAPHGTAPDLYKKYLDSNKREAHFNSSALFYAIANAFEVLGKRESNHELIRYSNVMKQALIETVKNGIITGDIKGKTKNPDKEKVVDMYGFLDAIEEQMNAIYKS